MAAHKTFQKRRRNSPKITICLFHTIVTHSVDGVTYYRMNNNWMEIRVLEHLEIWVFFTNGCWLIGHLHIFLVFLGDEIVCLYFIRFCFCSILTTKTTNQRIQTGRGILSTQEHFLFIRLSLFTCKSTKKSNKDKIISSSLVSQTSWSIFLKFSVFCLSSLFLGASLRFGIGMEGV